jgi:hypothetical protein
MGRIDGLCSGCLNIAWENIGVLEKMAVLTAAPGKTVEPDV